MLYQLDDALIAEIKAAREGDSNDAEHSALAAVADEIGIHWVDPDDVLNDEDDDE